MQPQNGVLISTYNYYKADIELVKLSQHLESLTVVKDVTFSFEHSFLPDKPINKCELSVLEDEAIVSSTSEISNLNVQNMQMEEFVNLVKPRESSTADKSKAAKNTLEFTQL